MNTKVNFTVRCVFDLPRGRRTVSVLGVTNSSDEDISRDFLEFCRKHGLPVTTEEELEKAAYAFGGDA